MHHVRDELLSRRHRSLHQQFGPAPSLWSAASIPPIVDSGDDYVFIGAGRIVGTGTTLVKRGSGKLTVSNTAANTYTGLTTVEGGRTLQLGAAAQTTVDDWSKLVFEYDSLGNGHLPLRFRLLGQWLLQQAGIPRLV